MRRDLTLVFLVALAFAFASGFWTGRKFPAHHYERFRENAQTNYYIDTATGKVCDSMKAFQDKADKYALEHTKSVDQGKSVTVVPFSAISTEDPGLDYLTYIPACGNE